MDLARTKRHGALLAPISRPRAVWRYLKNPATPKLPKLFLLFALAYVIMPLDLIPDYVVPIVGWFDDIGAVSIAIAWIARKAAAQDASVRLLTEESS